MSSSQPARKRLPVRPSEENLKKQAKRLAKLESIQLADAQHRLAAEYGCRNWAELMHVVEVMNRGADQLAFVNRKVEPLPQATRSRDLTKVRDILASGEFTQHDLDAALAHAAWYGGDTPDVLSVRKELFDLLLDHGADPDGQYGSAYGPIIFGTGECIDPHGLQWLIDAGADVTFPPVDTKYGKQCPLSYWLGTYVRGRNDVKHRGIDILLALGAFIPPEVSPPILAIHRGDAKTLAELLDQDRSLISRRFPDMPYGNLPLVGATLLHCAIEFGEMECLHVLLDRNADINIQSDIIEGLGGQTPIYHAINTNGDGCFHVLEYLVKRFGRQIDMSVKATWRGQTTPLTPLEYAEKAAREIDPKWAHFRPRVNDERTILQSLTAQASIKSAEVEGTTDALMSAARLGQLDAVRLLLGHGADLNRWNDEGNTLLWFVCQSSAPADDRIAIAKLLIDAGAHIRHRNRDGSTALHEAAWRGPIQMVELLLRHGAREWQPDNKGKVARDYARNGVAADKEQIIALLDRPVIDDPNFKSAVRAIQAGDLATLQRLLTEHPNLVHDRAIEPDCYPPSYFSNPRLLWFIAFNPNLIKTMPANIIEITKTIIDAGAEKVDLDYTLELVMTSSPAREQKLQRPLIEYLMAHGASVNEDAVYSTLGHGERDAMQALLDMGLPVTAPIAAGMGRVRDLERLLIEATDEEKHGALSLAVFNRELAAARLCLDAGADLNQFMRVHAHSLPIHQAAVNNDVPMLKLLVERGTRLDIRDTLWNGTPLGWAIHTKKPAAEAYLRSIHAS